MGFLTPIRMESILGRDRAVVLEDIIFEDSQGRTFRVPKGFVTDGASVPRLLRWLTPSKLQTLAAAAIHDGLYRSGEIGKWEADRIFREAMAELQRLRVEAIREEREKKAEARAGASWWRRGLAAVSSGLRLGLAQVERVVQPNLMWAGVAVGAWPAWWKHRRAEG